MSSIEENSVLMSDEQQKQINEDDANARNINDNNHADDEEEEEEEDQDFRESERFKVWRKHTRDVYKTCLHFEPAWPCRTIQFLPFMKTGTTADLVGNPGATSDAANTNNNNKASSSAKQYHSSTENSQQYHKVQTLLTGSITGGAEQNYLKLLNLSLPGGSGTRAPFFGTDGAELDKETGEVGGYGFAPEYIDFNVAARFFHDGDVLKARHMPSNPNVYLTASSTGKCYLFDYATMSMSTAANKFKRPKLPPAPVMVANKKDKYERDQIKYKKLNKEQEDWDKRTKGEGQHKVVLNPNFGGGDSNSNSTILANSCEFNILKPSGVVCAGFENGAILQWNLSDPPSSPDSTTNEQQQQQPKKTTFAQQQQKKLELNPSCVRWCRDPNNNNQNSCVTEVAFSYQDENIMSSSSLDGLARIWDLRANPQEEAQQIFNCRNNNNNNKDSSSSSTSFGATTTSFSIFESNKLAVGYSDGMIRIWDSRNNKEPLMMTIASHQKSKKDVTSVQWSPHDKNVLASGGEDGNVVWCDVAKQNVMFVHYGHPSGINDMCWCWQDIFAGLMVSVDDHGVIAWSPRGYLLE